MIEVHPQTWVQGKDGVWEARHWPTDWVPLHLPERVLEDVMILVKRHACDARGLLVCVPDAELKARLTMAGIVTEEMPG